MRARPPTCFFGGVWLVTTVAAADTMAQQFRRLQDDAFLAGYFKDERQEYTSWKGAAEACAREPDCPGFTLEQGGSMYTLRHTKFPLLSPNGEKSWIKESVWREVASIVERDFAGDQKVPSPLQLVMASTPLGSKLSNYLKVEAPSVVAIANATTVATPWSLGDVGLNLTAVFDSFSRKRLFPLAEQLKVSFSAASPFPHAFVDNLFVS